MASTLNPSLVAAYCAGGCGKLMRGGAGSLPPDRRMCQRCRRDRGGGRRERVYPAVQPLTECAACGAPLARVRGGKPRKWCNQNCAHWAMRHPGEIRPRQRECTICGTDISGTPTNRTICSPRCRNIRDAQMASDRNLAIARICGWCGTEFFTKTPTAKCCSLGCAQKFRSSPDEATRRVRRLEVWRRKNVKRRADDIISEPYTLAEIARRDGLRCGLCHRKVDMRLSGLHPKGPTIDHIIPLSISRDDTRRNVQLAHRACNVAKHTRAVGEQLLLIG